MGKRGPKRKPTAMLERIGNPNVARQRAGEPDRIPELPPKPELSKVAAEAWERYEPMLSATGVLSKTDGLALEVLVETYAEWHRAKEAVKDEGPYYLTPTGQRKPHPAVRQRAEARRDLCRMLREFGLTPASRAEIRADPGAGKKRIPDIT